MWVCGSENRYGVSRALTAASLPNTNDIGNPDSHIPCHGFLVCVLFPPVCRGSVFHRLFPILSRPFPFADTVSITLLPPVSRSPLPFAGGCRAEGARGTPTDIHSVTRARRRTDSECGTRVNRTTRADSSDAQNALSRASPLPPPPPPPLLLLPVWPSASAATILIRRWIYGLNHRRIISDSRTPRSSPCSLSPGEPNIRLPLCR